MKKLIILAFLLFSFGSAWAAEVTLTWDQTDFASVYSDPTKSGYNLYVSTDEGITKTKINDEAIPPNIMAYNYAEIAPNKYCYFLTAFNQKGKSGFSIPACGYLADSPPPVPTGLKRLIEEIISLLQDYLKTSG